MTANQPAPADTTHQTPAELVWLDPRTLTAHPANVRDSPGDLSELVASITAVGVLQPLVVVPHGDTHRILAGHRRSAAAIEAGQAFVPCILRADLADTPTQIAAQLVENEHRRALSTAETARGYQQLRIAGLSAARIAKATGTKPAAIKRALTVGASELALAAAARYQLNMDQALVLAECSADHDAVKLLVTTAKTNPGQWDHTVSRLRADRADARARQAAIDQLTAHGTPIIDDHSNPPSGAMRVNQLTDKYGRALDPNTHQDCPGHAVALDPWDPQRHIAFCVNPDTHGHTERYPSGATHGTDSANGGKLDEAAKAERREVIENNKAWRAAEGVRLAYIRSLLARKTPPKDTLRFVTTQIMTRPERLGDGDDDTLADLLGTAKPDHWGRHVGGAATKAASDPRLPLLLLAQVGATHEKTMGVHTWRHPHPETAAWLAYLAATGYQLSPIEQRVIDDARPTAGDPAQRTDGADGQENTPGA